MNRNSGNVSNAKKLISGANNNSKPNRKTFQKLSESSSLSSNRNSSAQSEEDVRISGAYVMPQVSNNASLEEQQQLVKKLQAQAKDLKHKVRVLEDSVESKDYSLGTIAREKDRAVGEIRRLEKCNKQLRQQLNDERNHYLEEKEKFCEEMTRYKKKLQNMKSLTDAKETKSTLNPVSRHSLITQSLKWNYNKEKGDFASSSTNLKTSKSQKLPRGKDRKSGTFRSFSCSDSQLRRSGSLESLHLYEGDDLSLQMAALRTENAKLRSIICERDERNYELCLRFLRMKHYKNDIRTRFQDLENEYLQVIANLMDKIDEARQEFNFIIDQKFKRPLHSTNAMYLQLVQRNSRLAFENASLRLENQCLKKELNKYMNGVSDYDRKIDQMSAGDDPESKLSLNDSRSDSKLKRIKKNVNFKEIRTIYERDFTFKNSDTDSNYMSKTTTTVPSNGSLADHKSNESVMGRIAVTSEENQKKVQQNFQVNSLPNEILNKIFKRIDTSSCQTLNSTKSKELIVSENKLEGDNLHSKSQNSSTDKRKSREEAFGQKLQKDKKPVIIEHKSPSKILDSSSPNESKESVKYIMKEKLNFQMYAQSELAESRMESGGRESLRRIQKEPEKTKSFRSRMRAMRASRLAEKDSGSSVDFPSRRLELVERYRLGRNERISQSNQEREALQAQSRFGTRQIIDSCGLQEKMEMSEPELPSSVESKTQTTNDISKSDENNREKPEEMNPRIEIPDTDEDLTNSIENRKNSISLIPALGSRSRSSNRVNLQDELLEATKGQMNEELFWRQDSKLPIRKSTKTYGNDPNNFEYKKDIHNVTDPISCSTFLLPEPESTQTRRTEGSKRFSQRLISTSPEQLRNILTQSQLGNCYRMAPIIVGHATTEINQGFKCQDPNSEIFLQLVIPATTVNQTSQIFSEEHGAETAERRTVEKETSISGLTTVDQSKIPAETRTSDVGIPVNSLPTSSSTMDVADSATINDVSSIMMRTLSAPGLLESNWLDPYNVCEMKDCG